jgi:hypothetical protein
MSFGRNQDDDFRVSPIISFDEDNVSDADDDIADFDKNVDNDNRLRRSDDE